MLQVCTIAGLVGQRLARGVNGLRIFLEDRNHLSAVHGVALLMVRSRLARWGRLGEAFAILLAAFGLDVAIGVLVPLKLGRESPQHGGDPCLSLFHSDTCHGRGDIRNERRRERKKENTNNPNWLQNVRLRGESE